MSVFVWLLRSLHDHLDGWSFKYTSPQEVCFIIYMYKINMHS